MKNKIEKIKAELSDDDIGKRRISVQSIGKIVKEDPTKIKEVIPELIKSLYDDDVYIRSSVAKLIGDIGSKKTDLVKIAIPELLANLNDKYLEVKENVLYALKKIGAQSPYLPTFVADKFLESLRMQYIQDDEDISDFQLLVKQIENEDSWTRYFTIGAIVDYLQRDDVKLSDAQGVIDNIMESNDSWVRKGGLWAVCQLWSDNILEKDPFSNVKNALYEESPELRLAAINCVKIILQKQPERVKELTLLLIDLFKDNEKRIRALAYKNILEIYQNYPDMKKAIISTLTQLKREASKAKQKETTYIAVRALEHIAKPKIEAFLRKKKGRVPLKKIAKKYDVSASFVKEVIRTLSDIDIEIVNENELLENYLESLNSDEEKTVRKFLKQLRESKGQKVDLKELTGSVFNEEKLNRVIHKLLYSGWIKGEIQEKKKFLRKKIFFVGSLPKKMRDLVIIQ